jgi:hypothetical protein
MGGGREREVSIEWMVGLWRWVFLTVMICMACVVDMISWQRARQDRMELFLPRRTSQSDTVCLYGVALAS